MDVTSATDLKTRFAGVIWGEAKTGKTTWAMSLPGRKLLVNFDPDGYLAVAHRDDFDVIDLSQYPPQEAIKNAKKVGTYILENADKYKSVVVDSLTTLTDLALHDAVERGLGKSSKFTPTIDTPGLTGYGGRNNNVNDVIDKIMRATAQKTLNCFFIAHMDDPEYDQDGKNIIQQTIMLSAKIRNKVGLKVSEIYHLEKGSQDRRFVHLSQYGNKKPMGSRIFDTAKVQKFQLRYTIDNPDEEQPDTLAAIFAAWESGGRQKLTKAPS